MCDLFLLVSCVKSRTIQLFPRAVSTAIYSSTIDSPTIPTCEWMWKKKKANQVKMI